MDRLEFLHQVKQLAHEQIEASSCENDTDWKGHQKDIKERGEESVLYEKAKEILENAALDIDIYIRSLTS